MDKKCTKRELKYALIMMLTVLIVTLFMGCEEVQNSEEPSDNTISAESVSLNESTSTASLNEPASENSVDETVSEDATDETVPTSTAEENNLRPREILLENGTPEKEHAQFNLEDDSFVTAYCMQQGETYTYYVYEISEMLDNVDHIESGIIAWNIVIYHEEEFIQTIYFEKINMCADLENMVREEDVTFDGKAELLIWIGCGAKGQEKYRCYLIGENEFTECPNFMSIWDPQISEDEDVIIGKYADGCGSWRVEKYWFNGEDFELVYCQTRVGVTDENGEGHWEVESEEYYGGYEGESFTGW